MRNSEKWRNGEMENEKWKIEIAACDLLLPPAVCSCLPAQGFSSGTVTITSTPKVPALLANNESEVV